MQPDFVGWRAASDIDGVALAHHGNNGARVGPHTLPIVDAARNIDIEASQNFGGRLVESKNNLNGAIRILRMN